MYTRPMLKYIIKSSRARNSIPLILFSCVIGIHVEAIGKEGYAMKLDIKSTAFEGVIQYQNNTHVMGLISHHNCHGHSHRKEQVAWC